MEEAAMMILNGTIIDGVVLTGVADLRLEVSNPLCVYITWDNCRYPHIHTYTAVAHVFTRKHMHTHVPHM
jgi:hypothetical protein